MTGSSAPDDDRPRDGRLPLDLTAAYERAPVGLVTTAPDGTVTSVNASFLQRTGHLAGEVLDRPLQRLLSVGSRMYYETHVRPMLLMHGDVQEIALEVVAADGHRMQALTNAHVEVDADGRATTIRWAILVAEERRGYEQELLAAKVRAEASEQRARVLASTLQQTLVPATPPTIPGLEIGAVYRPAGDGDEIGGDFYDVFQVSSDDWIITLGDVQGKGVAAAIVTALARFTIRGAAVEHESPSAVLALLNTALRLDPTDRLCTALVIRLSRGPGGWRLVIASAGHPLPLLRSADGSVTTVGRTSRLLGAFVDPTFVDAVVDLDMGDVLLTYTDGVSEARRGTELFGEARIAACLASADAGPARLVDDLLAGVIEFGGDRPRDDIAIVAVRRA